MKNSIFTLFLGAFIFLVSSQTAFATNPISAEAMMTTSIVDGNVALEMKQETAVGKFFSKIKNGIKKIKAKVKAAYYKVAGMFSDPVRKWMWFWIIFGLLGIILWTLGVLAALGGGSGLATALIYIGAASSTFSGISFIVWIIKLIQG